MIFSLEVRRALKGDCLLLHFGTGDDPGLIVIDGGPGGVYQKHLKPRLEAIRQVRRPGQSLLLDMLMVSHIDDDHINGILQMTKELVDEQATRRPYKVLNFWYNTFDSIIGNTPQELLSSVTASFGAASLHGEPDEEGLDPVAAKVLASVDQGIRLRDDAKKLKFPLNQEFDGQLVMTSDDAEALDIGRGLSMTVCGPMKAELIALQKDYDAFLKKKREERTASLAAFTDTSIPNLSSIVVIAEAGNKRMLLTGDARGDKILDGLKLAGALSAAGTLHVDILKMPHHGSDRNMTQAFLEKITAVHYVFSGDGKHGNPERETLDMLRKARGSANYTIHLTYEVDHIDPNRRLDWENEQRKEQKRKLTKPETDVREDWDHDTHSLEAFFDKHPSMAQRVRIVDEDGAHIINLLDPVTDV